MMETPARPVATTMKIAGLNKPVSRLWLGCWGLISDAHWGERDRATAAATVAASVAAGANVLDTAEMYGSGSSETLLGELLTDSNDLSRDDVIVATKIGPGSMTAAGVDESLKRSLERLQTDVIDLWQTHWVDPNVPITEAWEAILRHRDAGRVRAIGVCNAGPKTLEAICAIEPPATNQVAYNPLFRAIETDILPICRERGIAVVCYSPLLHGLLSGRYDDADAMPAGRARTRHFRGDRPGVRHGGPGEEKATFEAVRALSEIAAGVGRSLPSVTLAWLLSRLGVGGTIFGASRPDQVERNVAGALEPLTAETIAAIDTATNDLKKRLGPNADLWQNEAGSRIK